MTASAVPEAADEGGTEPPPALLAFLGEKPSEAALRRPGSGTGRPPAVVQGQAVASAQFRDEDSSPDTPGLPSNDGGFDECHVDDARAPVPQAEPVPVGSKKQAAQSSQSSGEKRAPKTDEKARSPPSTGEARPQRSLPPRAPAEAIRSPSSSAGGSSVNLSSSGHLRRQEASFAETATPGPGSLAAMLGDASAASALRRSDHDRLAPGAHRSPSNSSRPRSGSRHSSGRERSSTPQKAQGPAAAALELDPLGTSGKRRFGGRG